MYDVSTSAPPGSTTLSPNELLQKALDLDRDGKASEAMWLCREGIRLKGRWPEAHVILGLILYNRALFAEAAAEYRTAIAQAPHLFQAHNNLGNALLRLGKVDDAAAAFERAVELNPTYAVAHTNLGNARRDQGRPEDAVALHHKALSLDPRLAAAHNNLGSVYLDLGRPREAIEAYQQAIALSPSMRDAHGNLAGALLDAGDPTAAAGGFARALRDDPHDADNHTHLAMTYLLQGDFARGWPEYEWRLRRQGKLPEADIERAIPRWDGAPLNGRTILLHSEQGLGDTIHFVRYAARVAARGGRVVLRCQAPLAALMASVPGVSEVVPAGGRVPACDVQCPLLSFPVVFNTDLATIPNVVPYIAPDPARVAAWRERFARDAHLRVGLVWAGSPTHKKDRLRSLKLEQLAPLFRTPGARFYSLQKGKAVEQVAKTGLPVASLDADIRDFSDTAAALTCMDLLVSVDTSVAHLAGALGRPAWVMLPFSPDWRWMLGRSDSPWYPTLRLIRQSRPGEWGDVINRIALDLPSLTRARSAA